jgi:hypothetical protein
MAAAAAGGALASGALMRPPTVSAANGDPVKVGQLHAGTAVTEVRNTAAVSNAVGLKGFVTTAGPGGATAGVWGQSAAQNGSGVFGMATNTGTGTKGVYGRSTNGTGVVGEATAASGVVYGVKGTTPSTSGTGVQGVSTATTGPTFGVHGQVASAAGRGVQGTSTATNGIGVFGEANNGLNARGVSGRSQGGSGLFGEAPSGYGVYGSGQIAVLGWGSDLGVWGRGGPIGVRGEASGPGTIGVHGLGTDFGVRGEGRYAVIGSSLAPNGAGVIGEGVDGVQGISEEHRGVAGYAHSGSGIGVQGRSDAASGCGVRGHVYANSTGAAGVRGTAQYAAAFAGFFDGRVHVAGALTASTKNFLIDHPQDPANKTLTHSCVEAPEMLNVYRGNVVLDANGRGTIRLPGYFRALNRDYSYQLTPVGAQAPGLYVSREITARSFAIAGGIPGQKVCWQVTGARRDAYAQKHPLRVEQSKKPKDRGKYLNPEAFGRPPSAAMHPAPKAAKLRRPRRVRPAA